MRATSTEVYEALESVDHPVLEEDIVSLGLVTDVAVSGERVDIDLAMNAPFAPAEQTIGEEVVDVVTEKGLSANLSASIEPPTGDTLPEVRNTIIVAAGKGGVGKTTVAVNLAAGLAAKGARVGVLDADLHGPNVPTMLSVDEDKTTTDDGSVIPAQSGDLSLISLGMLLPSDDEPVMLRGPMLNDILNRFVTDVRWGPLDYLIVDLPPGTGDQSLDVFQSMKVTGAVLVTTPHPMAREDARKAVNMLDRHNVPVLTVVENKRTVRCDHCGETHAPYGREGVDDVIETASVDSHLSLPFDPAIGAADGPIVREEENPLRDRICHLVDTVADQVSVANIIEDPIEADTAASPPADH